MGWTWCQKDFYKEDKKQCLVKYCYLEEEKIEYLEFKKDAAYFIYNDNGKKHACIYLYKNNDYEWGYKDMGVTACPYYFDCSKKFYDKVKEIYTGERLTDYVKQWLEYWEEENENKTKRKDLIKNLKVGDKVKFTTANYGNQRIWTISHITDKGKVLFENYNLRGWKNQDFEVLPKDYVVTLKEKYIGSEV